MKRKLLFAALITMLASAIFGQDDKQIDAIRRSYIDTNSQIAEMEKQPDLSTVFAVELIVNKHLAPYPAVRIYQSTATFYYTYGDREKNPYPDRLLKITSAIRRSNRTEGGEFYFNNAGTLVFVLLKNEDSPIKETRLYYSAGRMIKMADDGKEIGLRSQRALEAWARAIKEATRLQGIFRSSLVENQ